MGDISTWNPVDNSNTTAPPDGWPEGMAPSAVNNSARAMMGAVRRWYDTVAVQLAGMLPLTGGTLTGALTASSVSATGFIASPQYNIGASIFANNSGGANVLYDSASQAAISLAATATYYDATNHYFRTNVGANILTIDGSGNVGAAGNITATSFIGNVSVPASGPISTGGTVTGGTVTSTGNITAGSNVTAAGSVTGGSMHSTGTMQVDGQCNFLQTVNIGPSGGYARFDGVGSYNVSGSWLTFSDRAVKQEATIRPYDRGLEAILALRPCAYRYRPELFGAEEAERTRYGLVADEVAPVLPEMVGQASFGGRHISTLNTGHISLVLLNACRELAEENARLAARITALEGNHV